MMEVNIKDLVVSHHFGGGVYAKEMRFPAGHVLVQHRHAYQHLSILGSGIANVQCSASAIERQFTGPCVLVIEANEHHRVEAVTDCIWYCIHATPELDATKIDETLLVPSTKEELRAVLVGK